MKKEKIIYKRGEIIGNCIFIEDTETKIIKTEKRTKHIRFAKFVCYCGNLFECSIESVKSNKTRSCGCLHKLTSANNLPIPIKHGETCNKKKSIEYSAWLGMKSRCSETNERCKKDYFDRNIKVCDLWKDNFESFLNDMGRKPSKYHSLDRKDNNLGYFKENCRWATSEEQSNNKSDNRILTYGGRTLTISQWAKEINVTHSCISKRLRNKWTLEKALTTRTKPEILCL